MKSAQQHLGYSNSTKLSPGGEGTEWSTLWTGQKGHFTAGGAATARWAGREQSALCCGCLSCLAHWVVCAVGASSESFGCLKEMSCCCYFPALTDARCYKPLGLWEAVLDWLHTKASLCSQGKNFMFIC